MYQNKKKSLAKRIEPAPRACQPLAMTTTPPLDCAEFIDSTTALILLKCRSLKFKNDTGAFTNYGKYVKK